MRTAVPKPGAEADLGQKMLADVDRALKRNFDLMLLADIDRDRAIAIMLSILAGALAEVASRAGDASGGMDHLKAALEARAKEFS